MTSLFGQLKMQAAFTPKKAAIVLIDRVYTYEMMVNGVLSVQAVLAESGSLIEVKSLAS